VSPENDTFSRASVPTLQSLGISRDQSSAWQQLAAIPESEFERRVSAARRRQEIKLAVTRD
jgi:hypothetical protein